MARTPRVVTSGAGPSVFAEVHGQADVERMLAKYKDPEFTKRAQQATSQGAEVLRRPVQREAGRVSQRMSQSVYVRKALRDLPGTTVGFRPKIAWFRHFVIGGTKAHGPRKKKALKFRGRFGWVVVKRVKGVRPNPIIERVAKQYQQRVFDAMVRTITKGSTR